MERFRSLLQVMQLVGGRFLLYLLPGLGGWRRLTPARLQPIALGLRSFSALPAPRQISGFWEKHLPSLS